MAELQVKTDQSPAPVAAEAPTSNDAVPNKAPETAPVEESKALVVVAEPQSEFCFAHVLIHVHVHVHVSLLWLFCA